MDTIDRQIIQVLREDARKPVTVIAEVLGLSRLTIQKRIKSLEEQDVIRGYTVRTGANYETEKFRAHVLVEVKTNLNQGLLGFLKSFPEVNTIHSLAGRFDANIMLEAESSERLDELLAKILQHPEVISTETCILLATKLDRLPITS